jgi:hypothetical protein
MKTMNLALVLTLGCSSKQATPDSATSNRSDTGPMVETDADTDADADTDTDADTDMPDNLNGEAIDPPLDPVAFNALNMDDSARSLSDLTDGPTLMWFYPLAGSYG